MQFSQRLEEIKKDRRVAPVTTQAWPENFKWALNKKIPPPAFQSMGDCFTYYTTACMPR